MSDSCTTLAIHCPLTVGAVDIDLPDEKRSNSYTTLTIQRPLTVRTVVIDIPDEEWSEVRCDFSINKTFTFLAAKQGINIYLKPHTIHPCWEWEQIFDFNHSSLDFDKDRVVRIKTDATLS